jgi:hypothetical protein
MKYLLILFTCFSSLLNCVEVIKSEHYEMKTYTIIKFNGHTYVHLKDHWSNGGNAFLHDPDCSCFYEEVR